MRQEGVNYKRMLSVLRKHFPVEYKNTHKAWRMKISNANRDGVPVGECFKDFASFVYRCGWKPSTDKCSYQIHQIVPGEGYSLGNVKWLDQINNLIQRGDSARVRDYVKLHRVSRATAYRHIREKRIVECENITLNKLQTVERLQVTWYRTLKKYYPSVHPTIPHTTTTSLKKLQSFSDQWGYRLLTDETIDRLVRLWPKIQEWVRLDFGSHIDIGGTPTLPKLKAHIDFILPALAMVESKILAETQKKIDQEKAKIQAEIKAKEDELQSIEQHKLLRQQALESFEAMCSTLSNDDIAEIARRWGNGCEHIKAIRPEDVMCSEVEIQPEYAFMLLERYRGTMPDPTDPKPVHLNNHQKHDLQCVRALFKGFKFPYV